MNKETEFVDSVLQNIYSNIDGINGIHDLEDRIGHKLYDKWYEENLHNDVMLGIIGGSTVGFVYVGIEPTTEEYGIYAKNSSKVSLMKDLNTVVSENKSPEVVVQVIKSISEMQTEGATGLHEFIRSMREKYGLPSHADYNGDKFFIPLIGIKSAGITREDNCSGDCSCGKAEAVPEPENKE